MEFIDVLNKESWKSVYRFQKSESNYAICCCICEYSGTDMDLEEAELSERIDFTLLVPLVVYKTNNKKFREWLIKSGGKPYNFGELPTTYKSLTNVKSYISDHCLKIEFKKNGVQEVISFELSEEERKFMSSVSTFSFVVESRIHTAIGRVKFSTSDDDQPIFPMSKISITDNRFEKKISSIINNINRLKQVIPGNFNNYLDIIGSSDYEVYQSTTSGESLPSKSNLKLGKLCYSCNKQEITREHCSPKWMSDNYRVKPLIGNIFCRDCNQWFGQFFEKDALNILTINNHITDSQRLFISKWCIKTAITMSIASGVAVNPVWLPQLRNEIFPEGFEVYFNPNIKLNEPGFNYGVSRFNKQLSRENLFLFTLACKDFSLVVINKNRKMIPSIPFYKLYPEFANGSGNNVNNFADLHQILHEILADEKTKEFQLPIRIHKNN